MDDMVSAFVSIVFIIIMIHDVFSPFLLNSALPVSKSIPKFGINGQVQSDISSFAIKNGL